MRIRDEEKAQAEELGTVSHPSAPDHRPGPESLSCAPCPCPGISGSSPAGLSQPPSHDPHLLVGHHDDRQVRVLVQQLVQFLPGPGQPQPVS